ncbi:hypothetical protein ACFL27_19620 [candidate division CSSED10-310 bacterium]|uniref:DUF3108 domain-containing protein n=1 Tax=candidate division CSSED10-310 bacterium TaxID=2855610 RepID=A0ABV6Z1S3_UNCC1
MKLIKQSFSLLGPIFLILCLVSGLGFMACSDDDDDEASLIQPLEEGNTWTYIDEDEQWTMTVNGTQDVDGTETKRVDVNWLDTETYYSDFWTYFFKNHEDGMYYYGTEYQGDIDTTSPRLWVKYPVSDGESFVDGWGNTYRVMSLSEQVTVPAGTFTCIKFECRNDDGNLYTYEYWAPNVGYIKSLDINSNGTTFDDDLLTSYSLN